MARMIMQRDFCSDGEPPSWYFIDCNYNSNSGKPTYTISSSYPFSCAIHQDYLTLNDQAANKLKISIRRWIERNLSGDVIVSYLDCSYTMQLNYRKYEHIHHGYLVFHFESETEMLHFRLAFSEHISDIEKIHPDKLWMIEAGYTKTYTKTT